MNRRAFLLSAAVTLGGCTFQGTGIAPFRPALALPAEDDLDVPYVPTPPEVVAAMLDLAELTPSDYLIDLGCGDGRIPIAAARRGARALGVDIDPARIDQASLHARMAQVETRALFRRQDLFATPIGEASVIAIYLLPEINLRLRPRLLTELRPGARIVSHAFTMDDWRPDDHEEVEGRNIYLWIVPSAVEGAWTLTEADGTTRQLELTQRFQDAAGTLTGNGDMATLGDVTLSGTHFAFTVNGRRYTALVDGAAMVPDPDGGGQPGWRAQRNS